MTARSARPWVTIDLQAAQSPHYRERGVARYALNFTRSVVERRPDVVEQVLLNPDLPPVGGADRLLASVPVTTTPSWEEKDGGIFHALSPFELDIPLRTLWPRPVSQRGMRLVVTVYDLIPEVFADLYLADPGQRRRYRARREFVRAADHIMTLSDSSAADLVNRFGIAEQRITVVGAAASASFGPPPDGDRDRARSAARAAVSGLDSRFVIYNGAVEPRKNMERLVDAWALLPESIRAVWQLVLVCRLDDPGRHHYEVRARQLGIESSLLLTGFLPDASLARLYQGADLVVYPSLYEGYGLPVAEALRCGAAVIASDSSSLVELVQADATFDPTDTSEIAAAMERALTDDGHRAKLLAWAGNRQTTWEDVADGAVEVYERLRAQPPVPGRRRRIAVVTPWPPAGTGVAIYSQRLVAALSRDADTDVYQEAEGNEGPPSLDPKSLPFHDVACGGYDAVLLCLGNSEFHAGALRLLRVARQRALVLAHDVRLTDLYLHGAARGAVPEQFAGAFAALYPGLAPGLLVEGRLPAATADREGVLMVREVARLAERLLVTSPFAARLAALDVDVADTRKIEVWPFAYPPVVERVEEEVDYELICSFGVVNPAKSPETVLAAFGRLAASHPEGRLAFVGPVGAADRARLETQAMDLGVADRVVLSGMVSDEEYEHWLARAGLAVQLRRHTNGETSASVADCLAHGIATVTTALGASGELPGFVAKAPVGAGPDDIAAVLAGLLDDPQQRQRMGRAGQAFARARGFDGAARQFLSYLDS